MTPIGRAAVVAGLALFASVLPRVRADAQAVRIVAGRVVQPVRSGGDSTGLAPAPGAWVTLHRVGKDTAGPVDSVRTDAAGRYRFRYTATGAPDAVYFASVNWSGIAYFTAPMRDTLVAGDAAEITVFDTTSRTFPMSVRGRHLIVSAADSADMRTVIEVFELSNDSARALVAAEGDAATPTWSIAVPSAAREPRAGEGELSADAFAFAPGRVSVFAPIAPGLKQVSFSYRVPASSFPISYTAEHGAVVFEVLLEEPQGKVVSESFTLAESVTLEGRTFRRFLAQDVPSGARVLVELPTTRAPSRNLYIAGLLVGIGFLMLLVLTRAMRRRSAPLPSELVASHRLRVPDVPMHERIAAEIAALDATYARQSSPSDAVRTAYEARRAELVAALGDALAGSTPGR